MLRKLYFMYLRSVKNYTNQELRAIYSIASLRLPCTNTRTRILSKYIELCHRYNRVSYSELVWGKYMKFLTDRPPALIWQFIFLVSIEKTKPLKYEFVFHRSLLFLSLKAPFNISKYTTVMFCFCCITTNLCGE